MNDKEITQRIIRKELNFDFGQFFYPQEKRRIFETRYFYSELTDIEGSKKIIKATLYPNHELGTLNTFDERVFYALIETWQEQDKQKYIYFSMREIARKLKLNWGANNSKAIESSLIKLRTAYIKWEGSFYNKKNNEYISIKNPFSIINHLELVSNKTKGVGSQVAEFSFDERTLKNLNLNHSRPIRFDIILSFNSPLSQALYTQLDRKLYGTKEYSRTTEGLLIKDLGLLGTRYKQKKLRIQTIKKAANEIIKKELSYGEIIEQIELENKERSDAILTVKRSGASKLKGTKVKIAKTNTKVKATNQIEKISEETKEVLEEFDKAFSVVAIKSLKVISKVDELLELYGLEKIKFLISFSKQQATRTNYQPNSFNGITKYLENALRQFEENQKLLKSQLQIKEKEKAKLLSSRNDEYKAEHQEEYYQYVLKKLEMIAYENPNEYKYFLEFEESDKFELKEKYKNKNSKAIKILEVEIRHFDKDSTRANRVLKYFQNHPEIKVNEFWEWDTARKVNLVAV